MFLGVVHSDARKVIASLIPKMPERVHIICSGNFSTETTLRLNGYKGQITGCDVSLYTCAIGAFLASQPFTATLNLDLFPEYAAMLPYMETPEGIAACVAVAFDALQFDGKKGTYNQRMLRAYFRELPSLLEQTVARLKKKKEIIPLDAFYAQDGWVRAQEIPPGPNDLVMCFPPTYAAGYEKMYAKLATMFTWDQPAFKELTSGAEFAGGVCARPGPWIVLAEVRDPDIEAIVGSPIAQIHRSGSKDVLLYSSLESKVTLTRRSADMEPDNFARIQDSDVITAESKVSIHEITPAQANYIRQVYCSVKPIQGAAPFAFAVCVDGKLIGITLFRFNNYELYLHDEKRQSLEIITLLGDMAVSSDVHQRLSKLIVNAIISADFQTQLSKRVVQQVNWMWTVVFSQNPVSMKYRGTYTIHTRHHEPSGDYKITYYAPLGKQTLTEVFSEWFKNHYRRSDKQAVKLATSPSPKVAKAPKPRLPSKGRPPAQPTPN